MLAVMMLTLSAASCSKVGNSGSPAVISNGSQANSEVLKVAQQVVEAFKAQNGKTLSSLIHPVKGVRFSPSAYVDVASDVVFSKTQVDSFWTDEKIYAWGYADGTGDPISMTASQYCRTYIMDRDFSSPSSVNVNNDRAAGNTNNNAALAYPQGIRVEYYIEPAVRNNIPEQDWAALRLVFEKMGESWFLVAVIHDEWST